MTPELADELDGEAEELPRMTLLDHLDELRKRLFASVAAIFIAFIACWYFSPAIFHWLQKPILDVLPADDKLAFTDLAGPFMLYI
ncbi:MAG: twin-arginine translocase subunit TatC, partial [Candidatus Aminicenantes bacterium]